MKMNEMDNPKQVQKNLAVQQNYSYRFSKKPGPSQFRESIKKQQMNWDFFFKQKMLYMY